MNQTAATDTAPSLRHVQFRRDGDRLCVEHAPSTMWFARYVLEGCRTQPDVGLSFDGAQVTLRASNGQWIWKLTGRRRRHRWNADGEFFDMVEGVWPD